MSGLRKERSGVSKFILALAILIVLSFLFGLYLYSKKEFESLRLGTNSIPFITFICAFIAVFIMNLLPAFGPPTWMVLSIIAVSYNLPVLELAVLGAIASLLGRYGLVKYTQPLTDRFLPRKQKKNINYLSNFLKYESGWIPFIVSFLYSLGPLPSNTMFIVAGAAKIRLRGIFSGFFIGRLISYSLLITAAKALVSVDKLFSPEYLVLDAVGILLAVGILFADWEKIIKHMIEKEKSRRAEIGFREVFKH